ncbi:MAG: uracil-DNA glycosylase [Phototrophicaceae bacterium]|jgi:DNA polymerase
MSTWNTLDEISAQVKTCQLCKLANGRTNAVPGSGSATAEILFIGEGPGATEDEQGVPFVGRSGQYLNYLLNLIQLNRPDVFITNVVKCRPPENRDPEADEIAACRAYLDRQIELIDPAVIVTVGRYSMARYFPGAKITAIHGQPLYKDKRAFFPIFHPAAALRNPGLRIDMETDIKRLPEVIAEVRRRRASSDFDAPPPPPDDGTPPQQLTLL